MNPIPHRYFNENGELVFECDLDADLMGSELEKPVGARLEQIEQELFYGWGGLED